MTGAAEPAPRNAHTAAVIGGATALLALITWVDWVTGYEFGFFIFYFIPVALAAWYGSRAAGVAYAIASGACWYLSDRLSLHPPQESAVEVGAEASEGWVTISIADRGPGIPSADLPHVFDRFYRGQGTRARAGLGIGLYSVRLLVEAHGGRVRVTPGRQGGTVFDVALPAPSYLGRNASQDAAP